MNTSLASSLAINVCACHDSVTHSTPKKQQQTTVCSHAVYIRTQICCAPWPASKSEHCYVATYAWSYRNLLGFGLFVCFCFLLLGWRICYHMLFWTSVIESDVFFCYFVVGRCLFVFVFVCVCAFSSPSSSPPNEWMKKRGKKRTNREMQTPKKKRLTRGQVSLSFLVTVLAPLIYNWLLPGERLPVMCRVSCVVCRVLKCIIGRKTVGKQQEQQQQEEQEEDRSSFHSHIIDSR